MNRTVLSMAAAAAMTAFAGAASAQIPAVATTHDAMVAAAKAEGKVVLYAPIDAPAMRPLIDDFQSLYPGVKVEFSDLQTTVLYNRYLSEMAAKAASADIVWNTPMDLQFKLVQDGYAATYVSPEKKDLPSWAVWNDQLYAITLDPGVFVYNKNILKPDQIPQSHADVVRLFEREPKTFEGRVVSYDIEKAAGGFLMATEDHKHFPDFWKIPAVFGQVKAQFPSGSGFMIENVGSGESVFGYNQLGSYASVAARSNPAIGIVYPKDFVVLQARTGFISKASTRPNAARLLFDYMLTKRGQIMLSTKVGAYAVRGDVDGELTLGALEKVAGKETIKPITIGPDLVAYLDPTKRKDFLARWQKELRGAK